MPPRGGGGHTFEDYHEEQKLGKIYDSRLVRRLMRYAKPYYGLMFIAMAVVLIYSALQIAEPYLIKIAIDKYIIFSNTELNLTDTTDELVRKTLDNYREKLIPLEDEGYFIAGPKTLDPADAGKLSKAGLMGKEKIYLLDFARFHDPRRRESIEDFVRKNIEHFRPTKNADVYSISYSELRHFSPSELKMLRSPDRRGVLTIGIIYVIALILAFVFQYGQVYLMALFGQKILYDIRNEVYSHIQSLSLKFFDNNPVGRLVTRSTNDVNALSEMFTSVVLTLLSDLFKLVGIGIALVVMNRKLGIMILLMTPFITAVTLLFRIKFRDSYRMVRVKLARINALLAEHFDGIRVIKAFAREKENIKRFSEINKDYYKANIYQLIVHSFFSPVIVMFRNIAFALIIWYGGGQVIQNILQLGALVAFMSYIEMFFQPINALAEKFNIMQSAMASSERIFQILDTKPDIVNPENPQKPEKIKGLVEFDRVWFAYKNLPNSEDWEWVLRDVNFRVEPGESVAIVGETGAGKTTIISLLSRLYDVQKGEIRVDGIPLKSWDQETLRANIAVVLQDVFLFARDIKGNIRLNRTEISDEDVHRVARIVNADKFIEKLPQKYDEPVTERGSTLSAGQRQLLAFARALAFDPKILVLDEATANIDTETEQLIQEALWRLMENRTSIIIAHRLSTIQHVDRIIVMHKGRIVEEGNHQQLLAKGGIYYKLYQLQYKGQEINSVNR